MKVTANYPTYVEVDGEQRLVEVGETVEVDGRKYSNEHPDIKYGSLTAEEDDKPKRGRKQKEEAAPEPEGQDSAKDSEE